MTGARARTGWTIRQLPSGRWQAVIRDPATNRRVSLGTWPTELDADHAAQEALVDQRRQAWHNPRAGDITLAEHLELWAAQKKATGAHGDYYQATTGRLIRLHINPYLGRRALRELTPPVIRGWYRQLCAARLDAAGRVGLIPPKAYRVLRAALADAVRDELIARTPVDIPGAGSEDSPERPLLTPDQIDALADAAEPHRKSMILLAAWGGLRFGELAALRRRDVDLLRRQVTVSKSIVEIGAVAKRKAPKTRAGVRTVALPAPVVTALEEHLSRFTGAEGAATVFVGVRGGELRRRTWAREWRRTREAAGLPAGVHFHDLRHAAGTMAAQAGATERELQARLGHASGASARRYQHAAARRDAELAERLGGMMAEHAQRTLSARTAQIDRTRRV
ncbi:MAG: tyrosine-type recombinase/integrase [Acidimicrobiales bacterium]